MNPYESPTFDCEKIHEFPDKIRSRLRRPATALVIMSSIQSVLLSISLFSFTFMLNRGKIIGNEPLAIIGGLTYLVALIVICVGAAKMGHLESLRMAHISAILSCIPAVSPFYVIGIPFGIWSLILLGNPKIQAAFEDVRIQNEDG